MDNQRTTDNSNGMTTKDKIEVLTKDAKELGEINKKQEQRIHKLKTKALHLTNLYFVFQGVILSTIATKKLDCERSWISFALSLLAALLNTSALCHTIHSFVKCSEELDQNREDLRAKAEEIKDLSQLGVHNRQAKGTKPDSVTHWIRIIFSILGVLCFLGFSGVILYGCFGIIC